MPDRQGMRMLYSLTGEKGIPEQSRPLDNGQPVFLSTRMPDGTLVEMDRENAAYLMSKLDEFGDDCSSSCAGLRADLHKAFSIESASA